MWLMGMYTWLGPLKNISSSIGMMTFPLIWKNKIHVPNHQEVDDLEGHGPENGVNTLQWLFGENDVNANGVGCSRFRPISIHHPKLASL